MAGMSLMKSTHGQSKFNAIGKGFITAGLTLTTRAVSSRVTYFWIESQETSTFKLEAHITTLSRISLMFLMLFIRCQSGSQL
jgi:hypothetical protein